MLDRLKLDYWIKIKIDDGDLEPDKKRGLPKRTRAQELARRMGYKTWSHPSHIYEVLKGNREVSDEGWMDRCAAELGVLSYDLYDDRHIRKIFKGIINELNNTRHPGAVIARLTGQKIIKAEDDTGKYRIPSDGDDKWLLQDTSHKKDRYKVRDKNRYTIICNDKLMEPSIPRGSILTVDSSAEFESGSLYFVETTGGEQFIRIVFESGAHFILQATDTESEHPSVLAKADITNIHRVVDINQT